MARRLRKEVKLIFYLIIIGLLIYGNMKYDWIEFSNPVEYNDNVNTDVLVTYNGVSYTSDNLDADFNLFVSAYAVDVLETNLTKEDILNRTILNNMIYAEAMNSTYNETYIREYAEASKLAYLENNNVDNETYVSGYLEKGFTKEDIDDFFFKEALVAYYVENNILNFEIYSDDVRDYYEKNNQSYTYNDTFYVFKMILLDEEESAEDIYELAINFDDNFDLSNATEDDVLDAQNYWFSRLVITYSLDSNKEYTNGLYVVEKDPKDPADIIEFMVESVEDLDEYEISKVLKFDREILNEDNETITSYYVFERMPNKLPLIDVYDEIENELYQTQRSMVWNLYTEKLKKTNEVKFY